VPGHWRTFGSRTSPLTGGPRLAGNPAKAVLNYLYAFLEGEASIAAHAVGLDPGLGVIHVDQLNRDSLAMDLMEPIRPVVDRHVMDLLASRTFAARDFFETREGVCRITPDLARELAHNTVIWHRAVGRVAEDVARMLDAVRPYERAIPTPISERRRSAGRDNPRVGDGGARPRVARTCTACGGPVTNRHRRTCSSDCEATARAAQDPTPFLGSGARRLRELATDGRHPSQSPETIDRIRLSQSRRRHEQHDWDQTHERPDDRVYVEEILPGVRQNDGSRGNDRHWAGHELRGSNQAW
jgi:hypothetical protein